MSEEEEDSQIAQLISLGSRESNPNNKMIINIPFTDKSSLESLIQILGSQNTRTYAGYTLANASLTVLDRTGISTFLNKNSLPELAYGLGKYYNFVYRGDMHWLTIMDSIEYKKNFPMRSFIITLTFTVNNERSTEFYNKITEQVAKDLKKVTEVEPLEDFNTYIEEVIGTDYYDANKIPQRQKNIIRST